DGESKRWLIWAALGSVLIAVMDMGGVALTLPLMLVATDAPGASRILDVLSVTGITSTSAAVIALACGVGALFILKSVVALAVRWWQVGRQNRLQALASVGLLELYSASPYEVHRTRDNADVQ